MCRNPSIGFVLGLEFDDRSDVTIRDVNVSSTWRIPGRRPRDFLFAPDGPISREAFNGEGATSPKTFDDKRALSIGAGTPRSQARTNRWNDRHFRRQKCARHVGPLWMTTGVQHGNAEFLGR